MPNSFPQQTENEDELQEEEEEDEEEEFQLPPAHHPSAPPHQLFDISTTVDPSYVISMIRKLLPSPSPSPVKLGEHPHPVTSASALICQEPKTQAQGRQEAEHGRQTQAMESSQNSSNLEGLKPGDVDKNQVTSETHDKWEDYGCILWDLAASEDHSLFMVQNLILEVLLANLMVSQSSRVIEISLGILGNLACHEIPRKQILSTNGLVKVIVEQLLLDDVPCLCEACRVLTLCLQGVEGSLCVEALQTEQMLSRIFWIAENALNPQLSEKIVGLLLAMLESQQEAAGLLPSLMKMDLSSLLIKLLAFEMDKLKGERMTERYPVLDVIIRAVEAISTMDQYSQEICRNKELLQLGKELIELPDKFELSSSCVTAAVLIANILTDASELASDLSQDVNFLQGLFDVLPCASDDIEAQSAIWSVIARLLLLVHESEMNPLNFHILVSTIASKLDLIEDELLARPLDRGVCDTATISGAKNDARLISIKRISDILNQWKLSNDEIKNISFMDDHHVNKEDVDKLLDLCYKAIR